jgi:tRNA (Thr-GGU) A37 N-methylase
MEIGEDIIDGTPLWDIKPYVKHFDSRNDAVDGWFEKHLKDGHTPERTTAP